jgi:hypothetical protein
MPSHPEELVQRKGSFAAVFSISTLAFICALLTTLYVVHRNSFCVAEWKFIEDEVYIDAAINEELSFLVRKKTILGYEIVPFNNRAEFIELNPNCCKVLRGIEEQEPYRMRSLASKILGYYGAAVLLKYNLRIREAGGKLAERQASPFIILDSCAGAGDDDIGRYKIN